MSDIRSKIWNAVWNGAGLDDGECGSITDNVLALFHEIEAERDELRQALEQARDAALEEAAVAVGVLLPENGAGQPCDAIDRLIDATRRECVSSIRALQSTTTKEEE